MKYLGLMYLLVIAIYTVVLIKMCIKQISKKDYSTAFIISMVWCGSAIVVLQSKSYELVSIQLVDMFIK